MMKIVSASSSENNKKFLSDFIDIPKRLYQDCPQWVPWFDIDINKIVKKEHPFFLHSDGEFFIAYDDGLPAGRVCVVSNSLYQKQHNRNCAHFFFLDAEDNAEVFSALITAASNWAREHGCSLLDGPLLFGGTYGSGLLIDGFEHQAPMTMMPYNHNYYRNYLESLGFNKYFDVICADIDPLAFRMPEKIQRTADIVLKRGRFRVLKFRSKRELKKIAPDLGKLYNITLGDHPENYPLSDGELKQVTSDLLIAAEPSLVKVLTYDDEIVGYLFAFPDASTVLRKNNGKITPFGMIRLLSGMKSAKKVLFNGMGILPQYQRLGGNALLYSELVATIKDHGFEKAEIVHIAESTDLMLSDIKSLGAEIFKKNRIYSISLSFS